MGIIRTKAGSSLTTLQSANVQITYRRSHCNQSNVTVTQRMSFDRMHHRLAGEEVHKRRCHQLDLLKHSP